VIEWHVRSPGGTENTIYKKEKGCPGGQPFFN
jgi:hypothetical protein